MRLFVAVELNEKARDHLVVAQRRLENGVIEHEVRWVARESLHVTVKFLGEVPDSQVLELIEALREVRPLGGNVFAERVLCFPLRGVARIVAAGLGGAVNSLVGLYESVERACAPLGFAREGRAYLPHVTIGRNRAGRYARVARRMISINSKNVSWPGPEFGVEAFVLMRSELQRAGSVYTVAARLP